MPACESLCVADTDSSTESQTSLASASDPTRSFAQDLIRAFAQLPRCISPKYFYDAQGSQLFDRICELPEYYPTRIERGILREYACDIAALMEPNAELIEFGAGSLQKAGRLLKAMRRPARFVPIDISGDHLRASVSSLTEFLVEPGTARESRPGHLQIVPITADYTRGLVQALEGLPAIGPRYGYFAGSTIGNFTPDEALDFLRQAAELLRGGALILGTDLIKDPAVLHAAYNDAQGVTAAFNRNLLARANRELGADFVLDDYAHSAFYNAPENRIEMHLMALRRQTIRICGRRFQLREGESLHTENSYKFTIESARALAARAGFTPGPVWTDPARLFAVHWLQSPRKFVSNGRGNTHSSIHLA
jgi:dimethylhistidine N-methyltransferase